MIKKTLYVVHSIDTEGPLNQSSQNYRNYKSEVRRLYGSHDNRIKEKVEKLFKSKLRMLTLGSKKDLLKSINLIGTKKFRSQFLDNFQEPWIYNWFVLDHYKWLGKNPRKRILGKNKIFDIYKSLLKKKDFKKDGFCFHYHPKPLSEDYHRCGSTISNNSDLITKLCELLIDRTYFPNCFRAGHVTERFDLHIFWEQWIPFDYSNNSYRIKNEQSTAPRFGDWRRASKTWIPYNPDFYDYQKKGQCKRLIARSLPIYDRNYSISLEDVSQAFYEANKNGKALLSFFGHDFRDMKLEIKIIQDLILKASQKYPEVKIKYSNAVNAIRSVCGLKKKKFKLDAYIKKNKYAYPKLYIKSNNEMFGIQPFLAIKFKKKYYWQNLDFEKKNLWSYLFDEHNLLLNDVSELSIAANSNYGQTIILKYLKNKNKFKKIIIYN